MTTFTKAKGSSPLNVARGTEIPRRAALTLPGRVQRPIACMALSTYRHVLACSRHREWEGERDGEKGREKKSILLEAHGHAG